MTISFEEFLRWEEADRDAIKVKRIYVDIAEDLIAGILLSQIVYWYLPSKRDGHTKLRVRKDGELWLAKGRDEWWDECRITPRQFDRAIGILVDKGIVEKERFRFGGSPTIHIRLVPEVLMQHIENEISGVNSILTKGENPILRNVKMELDERVKTLTENTTEITTENTTLNTYALESACDSTRASPNDHDKQEKPRKPFRSLKQQQRFDAFWEAYPRKRSKGQAEKTWVKLNPDDDLLKEILGGLENAKRSIDLQKDGGQYIPYPSTWLNAKGWEDEYEEARSNGKDRRYSAAGNETGEFKLSGFQMAGEDDDDGGPDKADNEQ